MEQPSDGVQPVDILYLLRNPWRVSRAEWKLRDKRDFERVSSYLTERLERSARTGVSQIWRTTDGKPIGVLGCYRVDSQTWESVFFASMHMEEHALRVTQEMRTMLRDQAARHCGCKLVLLSASDHPSQKDWFRFLGFRYMPEKNRGGARCFQYHAPDA